MKRVLLVLAALCALLTWPTLASAAPLTLAEVSQAAERHELPTLRRTLSDEALMARLEALDPDAAVELQLSIGAVFEGAGEPTTAMAAYRLAVAAIARAHGGHDDLAEVDPLRRIAALELAAGEPGPAYSDIDRALAVATTGKHPSLPEVTAEHAAIRTAFLAANPSAVLPEPYQPRGGGEPSRYDVVEIFYATHRKPTGAEEPSAFYGGERGPLVFGKAYVSVPRDRKTGSIPRPDIWRMEFRPDPNKHVILTGVKPLAGHDEFFSEVSKRVAASGRKEVFVFIHGFNTSFDGGAVRTAQLAADLNIDGAPILYSWPSKASMLAYGADEKEPEVDSQIADLAQFLADVARQTGAARVHLIAHSMGNRFLVRALTKLSERPPETRPQFDEVVMAAPDVGIDDFNRHWAELRPMGKRFTLYASRRDKALLISSEIHGMQRLGDAHKVVVVDGLQTVDTTAASEGLLGHTDFAGSALDDFRGVIWYSLAPAKRCVLQTDTSGASPYWVFAGPMACSEGDFRESLSLVRTTGSPAAALVSLQAMMTSVGDGAAAADKAVLEKIRGVLVGAFDQPAAQ
jgi:esterase/lipase superfamily enzyme